MRRINSISIMANGEKIKGVLEFRKLIFSHFHNQFKSKSFSRSSLNNLPFKSYFEGVATS